MYRKIYGGKSSLSSYYEKFADGRVVCIDEEIPFEIPEGWEWCRFRYVAEIARGGSPRPIKDFITSASNGINWIKIGDTEKGGKYINKTRERIKPEGVKHSRMVHKGDFLLTNSMSFGRPYILNTDGCIHDGWLVISPYPQSYHRDFLYYLLSSPFAFLQFSGVVSGAVVQNLNSDKVADSLFPLPPFHEQERIALKLESIYPLVESYSTIQDLKDNLGFTIKAKIQKSILQEAIQGRLVAQDPTEEPASLLLDRIAKEKQFLVKEGKLKAKDAVTSFILKGDDNKYYEKTGDVAKGIDDEIPFEIPTSWAWCRLENLCSYIHRGKSPKYSEIKKIPVIAQKCNQWSGFSIEKAQFIDPTSLSSYSDEQHLQHNDLLWNSTGIGTLGRMAMYDAEKNPYGIAVADSHVTVIRPLAEYITPKYLYYYFSSPTVQNVIEDKADGSTKQKELATRTVAGYIIPLPPKAEQDRIVCKIEEVLASIMSR